MQTTHFPWRTQLAVILQHVVNRDESARDRHPHGHNLVVLIALLGAWRKSSVSMGKHENDVRPK